MDQNEAMIINRILTEHGTSRAGTRYAYGQVMPQPYSYDTSRNCVYVLDMASGVRPDQILRLQDVLDDRLTRYRGEATFTRFLYNPFSIVVPRSDPETVVIKYMIEKLKRQESGVQITLGEYYGHSGSPEKRKKSWLRLDLTKPATPHLLSAGATGSGKSTGMKGMVASLAITADPRRVGVILIDPKGLDFPQFGNLPHLIRLDPSRKNQVILDMETALLAFQRVIALMDYRRDRAGDDPMRIAQMAKEFQQVVIFVDEVGTLFDNANSPIAQAAAKITQRGRGVGVHLVFGTQKPSKALIGPENMANLPVRSCGLVATQNEGYYATGVAGSELGAHRLAGNGDMLLVQNGNKVWSYQAPFIDVDNQEDVRIAASVRQWWDGAVSDLVLPPAEGGTIVVKPTATAMRDNRHNEMVDALQRMEQDGGVHSVHQVVKLHKDKFGTKLNYNTAQLLLRRARQGWEAPRDGEKYQ